MASPFSMLGLISKSRRASQKRVPTTESTTPPEPKNRGARISKFFPENIRRNSQQLPEGKLVESTRSSISVTLKSEPISTPTLAMPSTTPFIDRKDFLEEQDSSPTIPRTINEKPPEQEWTEISAEKDLGDKNAVVPSQESSIMPNVETKESIEIGEDTPGHQASFVAAMAPSAEVKESEGNGSSDGEQAFEREFVSVTPPAGEPEGNDENGGVAATESEVVLPVDAPKNISIKESAHIISASNVQQDRSPAANSDGKGKDQRVESLEGEMAQLREELEVKTGRIDSLESEKAIANSVVERLQGEVTGLEREGREKERLIQELETRKSEVEVEHRHAKETWEAERGKQEEALGALGRENEENANEVHRLKDEVLLAGQNLAEEKFASQTLRDRCIHLEGHMDRLQEELSRSKEETEAKTKEVDAMERDNAEQTKKIESLRQELEATIRRNFMLEDQTVRQSAELQGLRAPLCQAKSPLQSNDLKSTKSTNDNELILAINALNLEIFQAAAFIADSLETHSPRGGFKSDASASRLIENLKGVLGGDIVRILISASEQPMEEIDLLPIQVALQACMVHCCHRIIMSWYPGHWEYGTFLKTIFLRIKGSDVAISEQWRAATQTQLAYTTESVAQMESFMAEYILGTIAIAGWPKSHDVATSFRSIIATIAKQALNLSSRINGGSVDDFELFFVHPDSKFDLDVMEDAFNEATDMLGLERVLCTTDLGLQKTVKGAEEEGFEVEKVVVMKPKVVLRSVLENA